LAHGIFVGQARPLSGVGIEQKIANPLIQIARMAPVDATSENAPRQKVSVQPRKMRNRRIECFFANVNISSLYFCF
jgi:hypothetical protein